MTSVLLPEGELRVARCDMLDKLIAVGDGDAALLLSQRRNLPYELN